VTVIGNNSGGTVTVGNCPSAVAFAPDGNQAYVTNQGDGTVSVIDTSSLSVADTIAINDVGGPSGIAVTPDGHRAYVTTFGNNVWVIDTAKNAVTTSIPIGGASDVAISPDGKSVYVLAGNISVIATATNRVVATISVDGEPFDIAIVPPPPGMPFLSFDAEASIRSGSGVDHDAFHLDYHFTVNSKRAKSIDPLSEPVTVKVGTFSTTIPPGSFKRTPIGTFVFVGQIQGVSLHAKIKTISSSAYKVIVSGRNADLEGSQNPIQVSLIIGDNSGTTSVDAAKLVATR
jgi:YVTN family beta-propeller protein